MNTMAESEGQDEKTATASNQTDEKERPSYISYFDPIVEYYPIFNSTQVQQEKQKKAQKEEKNQLNAS